MVMSQMSAGIKSLTLYIQSADQSILLWHDCQLGEGFEVAEAMKLQFFSLVV